MTTAAKAGAYLAWRPIEAMVAVFNELHPDVPVSINFLDSAQCVGDDGEPAQGFTLFPDDGGHPEVYINQETPWIGVPDVIAHELAHVVAGIEADHGPAFEAAYAALWAKLGVGNTVEVINAALAEAGEGR